MSGEKLVIYLTGGIATGKTTVAKIFESLGAKVVDADKIAHDIIKKGEKAYHKIVEQFGSGILDSTGEIDRKKLGKIVFEDKDKLALLESIVHPEVVNKMAEEISECPNDFVVVEIPLIYEKKIYVHPVIVVYASKEVQRERMRKRDNLSDEEIEARLSSQIDIEVKRKLADFVIDNSGDLRRTREQVEEIMKILRGFTKS